MKLPPPRSTRTDTLFPYTPLGDQRVRDAVRSGVEFGEASLARAEFHRDRTAAPARLRRRNIGQCPDGFQIDHFALPPTVSLEIDRILSKYWPAQKFERISLVRPSHPAHDDRRKLPPAIGRDACRE